MVNLLFNPQGRIAAGPFWQGVIILLLADVVLSALAIYGPASASLPFRLLAIALIYPLLCVGGKRLHDAGKSAWWVLAAIVVFLVVFAVVGSVVTLSLADVRQEEIRQLRLGSPEYMALMRDIARRTFLPTQAAAVAIWLVIAFVVGRLSSDPADNRYGPSQQPAEAAA